MERSNPLNPGRRGGRERRRSPGLGAPGTRWACAALLVTGPLSPAQAASLGGASVQTTAELMSPTYIVTQYLAPGLGACNVSAQALSGPASTSAACRVNPTDDLFGRLPGPQEAPEYTLSTSASATPATSASQLPALRVQAGLQRTPRLGTVVVADAQLGAAARHRGFITWDENQPIQSIQFDLAVTGRLRYLEPLNGLARADLSLDFSAQRGWLMGPDHYVPSLMPPQPDPNGVLAPWGTLQAGAHWFVDSEGAFYAHRAGFTTNGSNFGTRIEAFVPPEPGCLPGAANCSGEWQPWSRDMQGGLQTVDGLGELVVDQRLRITLGCDFTCNFFDDARPPGATIDSMRGVLVDFSALASAVLSQDAYTSFPDDVWAGHGFVEADFGHTFQVSDLRFFDSSGDVTAQTRGVYAGNFDEALNLAYGSAPVPEPGTWALWLAGLAGLGRLARRGRDDR